MNPSKPLLSVTRATQKRANRLKAISEDAPLRLKLFERVYRGEAGPRQAIKAFCHECIGFNADEIRNCTAPACPLFENRPFQKRGG